MKIEAMMKNKEAKRTFTGLTVRSVENTLLISANWSK
jgi:hypothetical protein